MKNEIAKDGCITVTICESCRECGAIIENEIDYYPGDFKHSFEVADIVDLCEDCDSGQEEDFIFVKDSSGVWNVEQ